MASSGGSSLHTDNIFQLLESSDSETIKDVRNIILENLQSTKETWLIHLLVDYYFRTQSTNVQEILADLREAQAKALIDKLHDGIKTSEHRLAALQLILYLVYRELPWCHQLVELPIFSHILKCLKTEYDVPILMTAVMIVVILLPSVPVGIGPYLSQIFDAFERLAIFCVKKPANTPEMFVLHLQVSLYSLFHRLYGMYPCSFTGFISRVFTHKENLHVYQEIVLPMLERVRLHPKLVMGQKEVETAASRWKNQETQDIILACSKLSLDLIEGSWEDSHCPVFQSVQYIDKNRILNDIFPSRATEKRESIPSLGCPALCASQNVPSQSIEIQDTVISQSLFVPAYDAAALDESPSLLIGLSTPPSSQRNTPATSFLDTGTNQGALGDTPELTPRQHTPSHVDDGEKTPLSRSSSRGGIQQLKSTSAVESKKTVLAVPKPVSAPHTTPTTPGSNIITSPVTPGRAGEITPFKSKGSAFASPLQSRSPAMRSLQFDAAPEEKDESSCCPVTLTVTKADTAKSDTVIHSGSGTPSLEKSSDSFTLQDNVTGKTGMKVDVPMESLPHVISSLPNSDPVILDQEVEEINERDDHFNEEGSPSSSASTLASQTELTAESVRQFMKKVNRIRFNSLTSNSSSSDPDTISMSSQGAVVSQTRGRARSCPPFKRQQQQQQATECSTPRRRSKKVFSSTEKTGSSQSIAKSISSGLKVICQKRTEEKSNDTMASKDSLDDVSSYCGSIKDTPRRKSHQIESVVIEEEHMPRLPTSVNPVFQYLLAPAKLAVCNKCHLQLTITSEHTTTLVPTEQSDIPTSYTVKGNEISLFSVISPPELLDRHIKLGSDIHAKELTKIPLTSKETTNWTHFGGMPPADEVNILRGQILLMQNQLMYERHKRTNHAKRNRRLLRRIAHMATLEEQHKTLDDQLLLKEQEIQQLKVSIKILQEDHRRLVQNSESDEYEKLVQFRTSLKENKDLKAERIVMKNLMLTQKEEYEKQQKKLENMQHENLNQEKQLDICKKRLDRTQKLQDQVFQLQKEVLLMQELHQKCQEKLSQHSSSTYHKEEHSNLIASLKADMEELQKESKKKSSLLEAYQTRNAELEDELKAKDKTIRESKRHFEASKISHEEHIKAVEERCRSLVHINAGLESRIMELVCKLDQDLHKRISVRNKVQLGKENSSSASREDDTVVNQDSTCLNDPSDTHKKREHRLNYPQNFEPRERNSKVISELDGNLDRNQSCGSDGRGASIVVAKDEVLLSSSNFEEPAPLERKPPSRLPSISTRDSSELDLTPDSGATSRSSYRVDSDASLQSLSTHSVTTGDSGCWPKVD